MIAATALLSPCGVVRQKLEFVFQVFASDTAIGDPLLAGSGSDGTATRLPRAPVHLLDRPYGDAPARYAATGN